VKSGLEESGQQEHENDQGDYDDPHSPSLANANLFGASVSAMGIV
jgi:hypothetical protein